MTEQMALDSGVRLYTFGSFRLGVHGPGADIDTLCVGPRHLTRSLFFDNFVQVLKNEEGRVTELAVGLLNNLKIE